MTVLITGHTGFKGSWLSLWLTHLGANVIGASLDITSEPSHFRAIELNHRLTADHRLDVRNGAELKELICDCQPDFVFHLAAQPLVRKSYKDPLQTFETNVAKFVAVLMHYVTQKTARTI